MKNKQELKPGSYVSKEGKLEPNLKDQAMKARAAGEKKQAAKSEEKEKK